MGLELAWGQLRRAYLRLFRRGYVERMAAQRLGECPNCPHNIVDPRDLKFYRNTCGFYFRQEDDPFHYRESLGFARAGLAELVLFSVLGLTVAFVSLVAVNFVHPLFWVAFAAGLAGLAFAWWFFRDPERLIPTDRQAVLAPADGTITHLEVVNDHDFPGGRAFRISIFLSIFSVHVNRIPRSGRVLDLRYYPGKLADARTQGCHVDNEQFWTDIEDAATGKMVRVKQIAGLAARRIVCQLRPGEDVRAGDRFGMIKFGSRTDLLLPIDLGRELLVKVGDRVRGGSTVLLRLTAP
ncbi:MAG TPA: phosphatidylserine decarboxylase [Gemmataceae bacterium]|nr:phosphatidylserine decarboxylase [Gemmataceae bacterium]